MSNMERLRRRGIDDDYIEAVIEKIRILNISDSVMRNTVLIFFRPDEINWQMLLEELRRIGDIMAIQSCTLHSCRYEHMIQCQVLVHFSEENGATAATLMQSSNFQIVRLQSFLEVLAYYEAQLTDITEFPVGLLIYSEYPVMEYNVYTRLLSSCCSIGNFLSITFSNIQSQGK